MVPIAAAGVAGVGAIGLLGLAGARVLRRRRRRREFEPEPAVGLERRFALAEPARVLGQRLAGESELRCLGRRGVWLGERQIWPSSDAVEGTGWELVVLLGIHRPDGVQSETLADILRDEDTPPDPGSVLRKQRGRLREELKRLVPDLDAGPLPTDRKGKVYRLDPTVIASDVHQFLELARWGKSLPREDAIAAYEEALALYQGDLLESVAVPTYPWLYDGAALATSLRSEYRRVHEEVRLRLADLYAAGSVEQELGRAVELYTELTAERPDDDRLWVALLRVQGRRVMRSGWRAQSGGCGPRWSSSGKATTLTRCACRRT